MTKKILSMWWRAGLRWSEEHRQIQSVRFSFLLRSSRCPKSDPKIYSSPSSTYFKTCISNKQKSFVGEYISIRSSDQSFPIKKLMTGLKHSILFPNKFSNVTREMIWKETLGLKNLIGQAGSSFHGSWVSIKKNKLCQMALTDKEPGRGFEKWSLFQSQVVLCSTNCFTLIFN